ncbi:MAG: exo-alpha-sialidase [Paenibacillaceae bacterium]|nr:exo-alpha-sialidase [Paenibacillaceae bacterium]
MNRHQGPTSIDFPGEIGPFLACGDGSLLAIYEEGRKPEQWNDLSIPQYMYCRRSYDNGVTWDEPQVIASHPEEGRLCNSFGLFADANGHVHHLYLLLLNWDEHIPYEDRIIEMKHIRSSDHGRTWSEPATVDYGHSYTGSINNATVLDSGRIVVSFSYMTRRKNGRFTTTAMLSDDHGQTWRLSNSNLFLDNGGGHIETGAVEPVTIELPDGRIWLVVRTQAGKLYESYSSDAGENWSELAPTGFVSSNSPAGLLRLRDGRVLMCWNHCNGEPIHHGISYARQAIVAAICGHDGVWRGYRQVVGMKREYDARRMFCYPWMVELADGSVLVGYYDAHLSHPGTQTFRIVRFDLEWLVALQAEERLAEDNHSLTLSQSGVERNALPDGAHALRIVHQGADPGVGATWNFPLAIRGEVELQVRIGSANTSGGIYVGLAASFLSPDSKQSGMFRLKIERDGRLAAQYANEGPYLALENALLPAGEWVTLRLGWDCAHEYAVVHVNGTFAGALSQLEQGHALSFVRLHAAEAGSGIEVSGMRMSGSPLASPGGTAEGAKPA